MLGSHSFAGWLTLVFAATARAQLTEQLHATFPGVGIASFARTPQGVHYLAGSVNTGGASGFDPALMRVEPDGSLAWSRIWSVFPGGANHSAAVGVDPSGSLVWVVAAADVFPYGVVALCWDASGNFQWSSAPFVSGTSGTVLASRVVFDPFGNGYTIGRSFHASPLTRTDVLLISWDPVGTLRFARELDGAAHFFDVGTDLVADGAGNVYFTGQLDNTPTAFGSLLVAKVDSNDNLLWTRTFDGTLGALGRSIALDAAGNVYAAGPTGAGTEALTVKLDPAGNTLWTRIQSIGVATDVTALAVDAHGGVVVVGSERLGTPDSQTPLVVAYDAAGNLRWTRTWTPPVARGHTAQQVAIGPAGVIEVAVWGPTSSPASPAVALLRFDGDGTLRGSLYRPLTGSSITTFVGSTESGAAVFSATEFISATSSNTGHVYFVSDSWSLGCPGDGRGAACPCASATGPAHGCPNSVFASGALLRASGFPTVSADTFRLSAEEMTGASCVFFQGSESIGPSIVDDGLGCVGGSVVRLGTKSVAAGSSAYPAPGDTPISVRGAIPPAGATRHYQVFYRNAAAVFCPPATSNRTNSVTVVWGS